MIGTWLRDFKWHNVRQLDAVSREVLVRLWAAGAGPADLGAAMTLDVDSTIVPVFGRSKQGAAFGYTKVRGYHPQIATVAEAGQVVFSRLRGGSAGAARGAKSFLAETFSRVRAAGATGQLTLRAGLGVLLQSSARHGGEVRCPILGHRPPGQADPGRDRGDRRRGVDADPVLALDPGGVRRRCRRTTYTAFAGTKDARTVRLIVRRVRPTPGSHLALFTSFDYHAFVTDRDGPMLEIEADHRRHAIVEQSIAELKSAGLAHLPSSRFMANAAWLALTVMAHNLARAVGLLAGGRLHRATATTLQRAVFTIPGRLVRSARRWRLRLPTGWPWAQQFRHRPRDHHRDPRPLLNTATPATTTKDSEKPGRPATAPRPPADGPRPTSTIDDLDQTRPRAVDPG